jgi:recombination DNA repair RAD52 pathway protein
MGFTDKQVRALGRGVPASAVHTRVSSGKELNYIEGWYAVAQANRIFGLDGWDRETLEAKCIQAREARGTFTAIYSAKVRVTVRTGDAVVVREGRGTGEAHGSASGEVHDCALKTAETDATKRALATFGRAFGLALYARARGLASQAASTPKADDRPT